MGGKIENSSANLEVPMVTPATLKSNNAQFPVANLPLGSIPFDEFSAKFALEFTTTEQRHGLTKNLSQTMQKEIREGIAQLLEVDKGVFDGFASFIPSIEEIAPQLAERMKNGGRLILIGSGSSGRLAIDIAAKSQNGQVIGLIAGGDAALIRAREGFEDSEKDGELAAKDLNLKADDIVILISASGSASFNVGCGHWAAEQGAHVLYFYNSKEVPSRTQGLFDRKKNPVIPLCLDIGPQAITGSTRLQGASLAIACLGGLTACAVYLQQGQEDLAKAYPRKLLKNLGLGQDLIRKNIGEIAKFAEIETAIFSDVRSNFRSVKDQSDQGYVTFIASENCARDSVTDAVESAPTFSTNPVRKEDEGNKKRAEFRTYMTGSKEMSWKTLLGRESTDQETNKYILACEADGVNSYAKRPKGKGNFVIGVAKLNEGEPLPKDLMQALAIAKEEGGKVGLIALCKGSFKEEIAGDALLVMENVPHDPFGFSETLVLKQVLNAISNSSMVLMKKVHGNQMIDVRASNHKLIGRCMRLILSIWSEYNNSPLDEKLLYEYILLVKERKKSDEEKGEYTPSIVKIVLAMLALGKSPADFEEIVKFLREQDESIDWIGEKNPKELGDFKSGV